MLNRYIRIIFSLFLFSSILQSEPHYGNWSGIIYTKPIPNEDFKHFTKEIQNYLLKSYKGSYVSLITYVVKRGKRYTVSIRFPKDGVGRSISAIGYNPEHSQGFHISYQNSTNPNKQAIHRINFTNSKKSDYENVVMLVRTLEPNMPYYLKIDYPAISDKIVDSKHINPWDTSKPPHYWGTIIKDPILLIK